MSGKRRSESQLLSPFLEADAFHGFLAGLEVRTSTGERLQSGSRALSRFDPNSPPLEWIDLHVTDVNWTQIPQICSRAGLDPQDLEFVVLCQSRTLRASLIVRRVSLDNFQTLKSLAPIRISDMRTLADRWQFEVDAAIVLKDEREREAGHAWRPASILDLVVFEWERVGEAGGLDPRPLTDDERSRLSLPKQAISYVVRSDVDVCQKGNPIDDIFVDSRLLNLAIENPDDTTVRLVLALILQGAVAQLMVEGQGRHDAGKCACGGQQAPEPSSLLAQSLKRASKVDNGSTSEDLVTDNPLGWGPIGEGIGRSKRQLHEWIAKAFLSDVPEGGPE